MRSSNGLSAIFRPATCGSALSSQDFSSLGSDETRGVDDSLGAQATFIIPPPPPTPTAALLDSTPAAPAGRWPLPPLDAARCPRWTLAAAPAGRCTLPPLDAGRCPCWTLAAAPAGRWPLPPPAAGRCPRWTLAAAPAGRWTLAAAPRPLPSAWPPPRWPPPCWPPLPAGRCPAGRCPAGRWSPRALAPGYAGPRCRLVRTQRFRVTVGDACLLNITGVC